MKKLLFVFLTALFLFGCAGTVKQSGYLQHSSHYKNLEHLKFSWWGYKNPTENTYKESAEQDWWGLDIPYIPAE